MGGFIARLKSGIALGALATLFAVIAFAFLAFALYFALLAVAEPPIAAALTGVAAAAVALIVFAIARAAGSGDSRAPAPRAAGAAATPSLGPESELAAQLGQLLGEQAAGWTRSHPYSAMGAALAAGFAVGASPELRRTLLRMIG